MHNILRKNKNGIFKHLVDCDNRNWSLIKNKKTKYYLRAEWDYEKNKRKRKFRCDFSFYDLFSLVVDEYNPFLSSWFDSFLVCGGGRAPAQHHGYRDEVADRVNRFISYVNANSRELFILTGLTFRAPFTADHLHDAMHYMFVDVKVSETSGYFDNSQHANVPNGVYLFCTITRDPNKGVAYSDHLATDNLSPDTNSVVAVFKIKDDLLSRYGTLRDSIVFKNGSTDTSIAFRDMFYLIGEVPKDYDRDYNNQMYLPLLDNVDRSSKFVTQYPSSEDIRFTSCIWSVGATDIGSNKVPARFIGNYHTSNGVYYTEYPYITDYPITDDSSKKGLGYLYVDDEGVCYCPFTGFALQCVVDYRPLLANTNCVARNVY